MFKNILPSLCIAAGLGTMAQAGSVTSFTNSAAYDGAVGAQEFLIDFNGLPSGTATGNFAGQVNFNTLTATNPDLVIFGSNAVTSGGSTTAPNNVGVLQGVLANDIFAMSMDIISGSIQGFKLFDDGSEIATVNIAGGGFFGLVSDMAFDTFELIPTIFSSTGGNDRVFIDNFQVNAAAPAVPVPPAMALFATGLLGFGALRRRASRRKTA